MEAKALLALDGADEGIDAFLKLVHDPGVAYTESRISGTCYEDAAEVACYRDTWSLVLLEALSPEDSRAVLVCRA